MQRSPRIHTDMISKGVIWTIFGYWIVSANVCHGKDVSTLEERLAHARQILASVPLIDGHNDLIMNVRTVLGNKIYDFPFEQNLTTIEPWASRPSCHTDLPRIREGQLGGQFWAAFVSCNAQYKNALSLTLEQIDAIHRLVDKYPNDMAFVDTADVLKSIILGILLAHAEGKIASLIGVEGGHSMDSSLGVLRVLYYSGVRYMTLTHGCNTPWADNSQAEETGLEFDGLTSWGEVSDKYS
ncbi:hypothetical protein SK128_008770 [Halocaridina rubra]|uniref:Dipeptidase n=1 Tax=Halocaridina rubra TaxID=373956 RepID=A0AAN8ZYD9_HALRR